MRYFYTIMPRFVKLTEIFSYNWKKCIPDEKTKHWLSQPLRDHSVAFPWERAGWRQGSPVFLSLGTIDILDQLVVGAVQSLQKDSSTRALPARCQQHSQCDNQKTFPTLPTVSWRAGTLRTTDKLERPFYLQGYIKPGIAMKHPVKQAVLICVPSDCKSYPR